MRTLKLGFDFDGVTVFTNSLKAYYIEKYYGVEIPLYQCRRKVLVDGGILRPNQYDRVRDKVVATEAGLWVDSMPGSLAYLLRLKKDGHHLKIITSRREDGTRIAKKWFEIRRINIKIVRTNGDDKRKAAKGLDAYLKGEFSIKGPK